MENMPQPNDATATNPENTRPPIFHNLPQVQTQLQVSPYGDVSTAGSEGLAPNIDPWSNKGIINASDKSTCVFRWNVTMPHLVKSVRWEIAGVGEVANAPDWSGKYPPLADAWVTTDIPDTGNWAILPKDFKPIFNSPKFNWIQAARFFVRVTPLRANGSPAGPPSAPVWLDNTINHQVSGPVQTPTPSPKWPTKPVVTADNYTPAVNLDVSNGENGNEAGSLLHFVVTREPAGLFEQAFAGNYGVSKPGDKFTINLSPPSQDTNGWDAIGSFVTGIPEDVESAVNLLAKIYNQDIKGNLVNLVASTGLGHDLASALVDVALSSCGIPPTLPDADALQGMGADYIIDSVADQAGVEIPDEVKAQMKSGISKLNSGDGKGTLNPTFYTPDPNYLYHPPVLYLHAAFAPTQAQTYSLKITKNPGKGGFVSNGNVTTYSGEASTPDPSHHKLKVDPNFNDPDLHPSTPTPGPNPTPKLPYGNGQIVGEPQTGGGGTAGGNNPPQKSDKLDFDVEVRTSISPKQNANFQGSAFCDDNTLVLIAHVHVPSLHYGESIKIPVIMHFPPEARMPGTLAFSNWVRAILYGDMTHFNICGQSLAHPHDKPW